MYDDESLPEMVCPSCGGRVVEDTQQCPHCGDWITPLDGERRGPKRWIFVIAVLLMLLAMLRYAL
jgi:predicted nucleic acid-binding Zn ribbon protein